MWTRSASREDLLNLLAGNRSAIQGARSFQSNDWPQITDEMQWVWGEEPTDARELPNLIIVRPKHRVEFLAWTSTFLKGFAPLTAYCRVVESDSRHLPFPQREKPTLSGLEQAFCGLSIAETSLQFAGKTDNRAIPTITCQGTLSFSLARSLSLGFPVASLEHMSQQWLKLKKLVGQFESTYLANILIRLANYIVPLTGRDEDIRRSTSPDPLFKACEEIHSIGSVSPNTWHSITQGIGSLEDAPDRMSRTREQRVSYFEDVLGLLRPIRTRDEARSSFICGYLASQIGPASMDYLPLVARYQPEFPGASLWYGLCAGLHPKSEVPDFSGGLGRRLSRDILAYEPMMDRPRCDISLDELEVLLGGDVPLTGFRTFQQGHLSVELAPRVSSIVRWPPRSGEQGQLFPPDGANEAPPELHQLGELLERAAALYRKMSRNSAQRPGTREKPERRGRNWKP